MVPLTTKELELLVKKDGVRIGPIGLLKRESPNTGWESKDGSWRVLQNGRTFGRRGIHQLSGKYYILPTANHLLVGHL